MILAFALAALFLQAAPAQPTPMPAASAAASPVPAGRATTAAPPSDAAPDLEQLRQMYRDTCEAREYGAYDDMCDQLRQQVRDAERQAAREARRRPKPPTSTAAPP